MFYIPKSLRGHRVKSANSTGTRTKSICEDPGTLHLKKLGFQYNPKFKISDSPLTRSLIKMI